MIKATVKDKPVVIDLLCASFDANISVNYVVKQDSKRRERIRKLMEYSFDTCQLFGTVYISDDRKACALTLLPEKKKTSIHTIFLDLKLIFFGIGLTRIHKVLNRDTQIKSCYPNDPILYISFIGVNPENQNRGIGTQLLNDIIEESNLLKRPIYLETSMPENIQFYKKMGFDVYQELDFGHKLYLMRKQFAVAT